MLLRWVLRGNVSIRNSKCKWKTCYHFYVLTSPKWQSKKKKKSRSLPIVTCEWNVATCHPFTCSWALSAPVRPQFLPRSKGGIPGSNHAQQPALFCAYNKYFNVYLSIVLAAKLQSLSSLYQDNEYSNLLTVWAISANSIGVCSVISGSLSV